MAVSVFTCRACQEDDQSKRLDTNSLTSQWSVVFSTPLIGRGVVQSLISRQDHLIVGMFSPDEDDLRYRLINYILRSSTPAIRPYKDALSMIRSMGPTW